MKVKKSLTGASAVPNSEDTAGVQICANSGENAEALSLKLQWHCQLRKYICKDSKIWPKKFWPNMNLARPIFATSGLNPYKFDRDSNQECRSVPRQACEQVQRGMQCHQVILQLLHALSDSKHCLFAHSFALPKIWVNPVPENYPLMLPKKSPFMLP